MFFNTAAEIAEIAKRCGAAIFVVPDNVEVKIKNALVLKPEEKSVITIEQVRQMLMRLNVKQTSDFFVIIRPADAMNAEAANAFLKNLEEPGDKVHFVLVTSEPAKLLSTILSRAEIYCLKQPVVFDKISCDDEKVKSLAKRLIAAKGAELVALAEELAKTKNDARTLTLKVLATAIEMLYKAYLLNQKAALTVKLAKFITAYEAISAKGHIKLHLVADLC